MGFKNILQKEGKGMFQFDTIEKALEDLRQGKIILVTDDPDREKRQGHPALPFSVGTGYLPIFTSILFGCSSGVFGSVTVRIPLSNAADILDSSSPSGRLNDLSKDE